MQRALDAHQQERARVRHPHQANDIVCRLDGAFRAQPALVEPGQLQLDQHEQQDTGHQDDGDRQGREPHGLRLRGRTSSGRRYELGRSGAGSNA